MSATTRTVPGLSSSSSPATPNSSPATRDPDCRSAAGRAANAGEVGVRGGAAPGRAWAEGRGVRALRPGGVGSTLGGPVAEDRPRVLARCHAIGARGCRLWTSTSLYR